MDHNLEVCLGLAKTYILKHFCENSSRLKVSNQVHCVNYFFKYHM